MADVERLAPLGAVDVAIRHRLGAVEPWAGGQQRDGLELRKGQVEVHGHSPSDARNLALGCPPASFTSRPQRQQTSTFGIVPGTYARVDHQGAKGESVTWYTDERTSL